MKVAKKCTALLLCLVLMASLAFPVCAQEAPSVDPRFAFIHQTECTLDVNSDDSICVNGWVSFTAGTNCKIVVDLERNGRIVETWTKSSSSGYVSVSGEVNYLTSGSYQAVMYVTCGSDQVTVRSAKKRI